MKIDRRSFLSLGIGAAAGTALSPLPWKITDDLSIWTQMWPWTPVPQDGEVSTVSSVCTLCPGGCGISVRKAGERAVKIEGLAGHPVNDGGICILGLSGLQMLYGPTRVRGPLKRVGERGAGQWQAITWEKAIEELAGRLGELRSKGQPERLAWLCGYDRGTFPALIQRFLTAYGSANFLRPPSVSDTYQTTLKLMQGVDALPGFDLESADYVVSFGAGLLDGWGAPVRMFRAHSAWREAGVPLVQVEPRLSNTAAKADRWLPVTPGTEAALALGIAHLLIKEGKVRGEFVNGYTFGYESWSDAQGNLHKGFKQLVLEGYAPEAVAAITGIDPSAIVEVAQRFAAAKHPLALCGRGQGVTPGNLGEVMAVHALNALAGNINRPGGVWALPAPDYIQWDEVQPDDVAAKGLQQGRIDGAGSERYPFARQLTNRLPAVLSGGGDGIEVLLVSEANPLYSLNDSQAVRKAVQKIPLVVSFSSFMDETAAFADLLLPNHLYLERYEDVPAPAGMPRPLIGLAKPVVPPQLDTRHSGDVLLALAKRMGGSMAEALSWESYETCLKETLGDQWDPLVQAAYLFDEGFEPAPWYGAFETPSGKFEFSPTVLSSKSGAEGNPVPAFTPAAIEGDAVKFPLLLIPVEQMRLTSGYAGTPPFLMKTVPDTILQGTELLVEINPKSAAALGLNEGSRAMLATPHGETAVRVHLFEGLLPGVVAMPRGLGHTAYDSYLADKGSNLQALIAPVEDPASGFDTAWGIRAKLSKV